MSSADALRHRADEVLRKRTLPETLPAAMATTPSPEEAQSTLHNLQVHQVELELQNDELRRTHEALVAARDRYFDLYNHAPIGYFTISLEGRILEVNQTASNLLGVDRRALVGRPLTAFILREDQDTYYLACQRLLTPKAPTAFELRMARRDGTPFWARVDALVASDNDGRPVWRMAVSDISEQKATEQALRTADILRDSWGFYRQIAESLPHLVWTCSADGMCDYISPQWQRYTGFPVEEQLGLGWLRQVHPDDLKAAIEDWNRAITDGTSYDAEFRLRRHDGIYHVFRSLARPLRNEAGVVIKWYGANTELET